MQKWVNEVNIKKINNYQMNMSENLVLNFFTDS